MNITNILQTLFSRLVILTLAVVFLSGCNPEEVLDDGGYEIKLLSTESVFREGEQLSVGVFDKVTGEQDVSANISSNNQSFELDEYVWTTDNSDLAEMALEKTYKNQIITKAPGKVVITATNSKRQVSFELTIAPALLNSVVISPKAQSIYLGQNKSFVVNGNYSDGSIRPITEGISWSIDNNDRASITNQGVVSSLNVGLVKVTASVTNELQQVKTNAVNLTITEAAVTKLDITAQSNIPLGRTGQVSAIAQFTDLTNDNVTTNVSWISTPENIINIDAEGNITTNNMGQVTVSAVIDDGYGTEVTSNSVEITISEKVIETIDIVPENQVILKDAPVISIEKQEQFTVEATYSTGDKEDISLNESLVFTSSDTSIATVALLDSGQFLIETFVEGTTTLTLSLPNRLDEQIVTERVLTVIKPVLTKIDISAQSDTFAVGLQVNWQAIGHYDDNTTKDISDTVTWSSSSSNLASFNQDKRSTLSVTDTGVTSITAQFINDREQLIVSEPAKVTLRSAIVVDVLTISDNANIVDGQVSVPQGVQVNFQLKGMLSDGTEQILSGVTWTATENELATLDSSSGILIATKDVSKLGVLTTTASIFIDDTNFSHDVIVTVTPAKLVSFAIELPENNGLYKGYSQPLKVMGTFSTDLTYDLTDVVTWEINEASKDKIVLSSIKLNTLEMVNAGDVTVSASYLDIYDENKTKTTSLNFTVAPALLTSMSISAQLDSDKNGVGELDVVSVASGQNVLFSAIGTYSDNSTKEITEQVTWLSSSPSFLTIIETGEDGGQANTFEPTLENTALTISALLTNDKQEDISSTFSFTIGDAVLENINLSPAALSFGLNVPAGKSVQLEIWGTYSDGSYKKITEDNAAVWSSNNLEIGTIVKETGLVTMEKGDPAALLITATETVSGNSFKGSLVLNRVDAIVEFIKITPDTSSAPWKLADGAQLNLKAFAVYSDLSEVEITEDENSTWSIPDVSDQAFISVENGSTFKGLVTALTETENKVTVNLQNTTFGQTLTTTADFVIGAAVLEFIEVSPTIQTITSGDTLVFTATGFTSNDETIDLTELATWSSQNINVAEFNQASSNVLQGISAGSAFITASFTPTGQEELTFETQVTVEPANLRSISIHPTSPRFTEIPQNTPLFLKGNTDLLTATGLYSDGTTATINGSVDWSIDNTNVAYISSVGVITPVGLGDATLHVEIEVVELGETKTIYVDYPFTVIGPLLKFIDITPATPVFVLGMQQQFTAKGIYSDNSIVDLTNAVTWTTGRSNELAEVKAGNITNTGVFSAERSGSVTVNASHPDFDDKAIIKQTFVSIETLDRLVIEHAGGDVYAGQKLSLNAYGVTSNNKQVTFSNGLTWQVSAIATIDDITNQSSTNSFTTNAAGVMTATATWTTDAGVTSKSIQIDIKDPLLTSISLSVDDNSIADGLTAQFTATGTYSDGSTQNITDDVSWNNPNGSIFTISNTGLIISNQPGSGDVSVYITNESGNKITSSSVTITVELPIVQSLTIAAPDSNNTISSGTSAQLSLTGQLTDGTTDLPSGITWESSNELNAIVTDAGLVSIPNDADIGATVTIKALVPVKNDANEIIEKTIILTVGSAKLTSLTLTTTNQTVPRGSTATVSAIGTYTDTTTGVPNSIVWESNNVKAPVDINTGVVTINNDAVIGDTVTIKASSDNNVEKEITLFIGYPVINSLSIDTSDSEIRKGRSLTLANTVVMSDGDTSSIPTLTWRSSNSITATIDNGVVTIPNSATVGHTATIELRAPKYIGSSKESVEDSILITVTEAALEAITLTPGDSQVPRGSTIKLVASGLMSDGSSDLPTELTWSTSDSSIATVTDSGDVTINNDADFSTPDTVVITVTADEALLDSSTTISKSVTLTVGEPEVESVDITNSDLTLARGKSLALTTNVVMSDANPASEPTLTWSSKSPSIVSVAQDGTITVQNNATVLSKAEIVVQTVAFTGSSTIVSDSIFVTVGAPLLTSIALSPGDSDIRVGTSMAFTATGTLSDGTNGLPTTLTWSSDNAKATVSTTGVVTFANDTSLSPTTTATIKVSAPESSSSSTLIEQTVVVTAIAPLVEQIEITVNNVSSAAENVAKGDSLQLGTLTTYSDGTTSTSAAVTWEELLDSVNGSVSTPTGLVTIADTANVGDILYIAVSTPTYDGSSETVSDSIEITITAAILDSIQLNSDNTSIVQGNTLQVEATGTLTDGTAVSAETLSSTLTWSTDNPGEVDVSHIDSGLSSAHGLITVAYDAVIADSIITATDSSTNISQSITITVAYPEVDLELSVSNSTFLVEDTLTITPSFTTTSDTISDTDGYDSTQLSWSSSDDSIATVGATTGIVSALAQGAVTITATHDLVTEDSANGVYAVASSPLTATIELTIENPTANLELSVNVEDILLGETLTIAPTFGTSANNSSASTTGYEVANLVWTSSDETVATVASGIVTSLTQGTTTITASLPGIIATANLDDTDLTNNVYTSASALSESAAITVTAPEVVDFDIYAQTSTILVEQTQLVINPVEIFSDKTTQALTTTLDWSTDDSNIIFTTGSSQTVNAHSGSIVVTSNNLTTDTTATITATHATLGTKTLSVTFRVDNSFAIDRIETSSPSVVVPDNSKIQIEAVAIYNDGSIKSITNDSANVWTTDDADSSVSNGLVTIADSDDYSADNVITATFSTETATTTLDIKDATLLSIEVYPQNVEALAGLNYEFKAYGRYSYNAGAEFVIADITDSVIWTSDDTDVITNSGGAVASGTATYTATLSAITGTADVEVVNTITSINLTASPSIISDDNSIQRFSYQVRANATYPGGHVQDITDQVFWSVTSDLLVNNTDGFNGIVMPTSYSGNTQTITASIFTSSGYVSDTFDIDTSTRSLNSLTISPDELDLGNDAVQAFTVQAIYDDATTEDVTDQVTWSLDVYTFGHINNITGSKGVFTSVGLGDAADITLTAALGEITDTTTITRTNTDVSALTISPDTSGNDVTIAVDGTIQLSAEGVFSVIDNTDFTSRVVWTSSDPTKVIISNAAETRGVATRLASGDVTITATYENLSVTSGTIGTTP